MNPLLQKLTDIKTEKDTYLIPGNVKKNVRVLGVTGSFEGTDTSDANAAAGDILDFKTAYVQGSKVTGVIPIHSNSCVPPFEIFITNYSENKLNGNFDLDCSYEHGMYLPSDSWVNVYIDDINVRSILGITPDKVKSGVSICGVSGTYTSDANATANDILLGKTAYVNGQKLTGTYDGPTPVYSEMSFEAGDKMVINWQMIANALESQLTTAEKAMYIPMNNCHETVLSIGKTASNSNNIYFYLDTVSSNFEFNLYDSAADTSSFTSVDTTGWSMSGNSMTVQEFIDNLKLVPANDKSVCILDKDMDIFNYKIKILFKDANDQGELKDITILSSNYLAKEEPTPPGPTPVPGKTIQFTQNDTVMINWAMIIDALETQLSAAEKAELINSESACSSYTLQIAGDTTRDLNSSKCGFIVEGGEFNFTDSSDGRIFSPDTQNWSSYTDMTVQDFIDGLKLIPIADRPIVIDGTGEYTLYDNYTIKLWFEYGVTHKDITLPGDFIFINSTDPYEYTVAAGDNIQFNGASLASALDAQLSAEEKAKDILMDGSGKATIITGFENTQNNYNMYDTRNYRFGGCMDSVDNSMLFSNLFAVTIDYFEGDYTAQHLINLLVDNIAPVDLAGGWVTYPNMIELVFDDETKKKIWLTEPIFEMVQNNSN